MGSFFDNLRNNVFDTTRKTFGYHASWTSRDGTKTFEGLVHFKNPTEEVRLQAVEYDENDWQMEYREGDFEGLFEFVEKQSDPPEKVCIDGKDYYVTNVIKIFDGGTLRANLKPINNDID